MAMAAGIMQAIGSVNSFVSGMMNAFAEQNIAKSNANTYRAQAQNIGTMQDITSRQYGTAGNMLEGSVVTIAARQGLKTSGTVANVISRNLTALNLDKGYQLYNLELEKNKATNNARFQDWVADTALIRGFFSSSASALGSAGNSQFFSGGRASTTSSAGSMQGTKMSGGIDVSNQSMFSGGAKFV